MAAASLTLGVVAIAFTFLACGTAGVPYVGTIVGFGAPLFALAGVVAGGIATSRARREYQPSGLATSGLVVSTAALFPALAIALTCGMCNSCVSSGEWSLGGDAGPAPWWLDAGVQLP